MSSRPRRPMHRPHGTPRARQPTLGTHRLPTAARRKGGAVPADEPRRDGGARMGRLRHRAGDGRCLCGSPQLRHGHHRPAARSAGVQGRHHRPAGLAVGRAVQGSGQAETVLRRHRRQSRLDGEPLHRGPPAAPRRRLHGRRRRRPAAGPLDHRLHAALPRGLQGRADRARRHRGVAAPHRPLRLLVRQGAPLDPRGREGRSADLRQCRARRGRGGEPPRGRRGAAGTRRRPGRRPVPPRARALHRAARRRSRFDRRGRRPSPRRDRDPAPRLRAGQGRQGGLCPRLAGAAPGGQPRQCPPARPAPRRPRSVAEPAADPALQRGDGCGLRPALRPRPHPSYGTRKSPPGT